MAVLAKGVGGLAAVCVTGAAGFIGYHVSRKLLDQGHSVEGIDNLNDYYDPGLKEARLNELRKYPSFRFHQADLSDRQELWKVFAHGKPNAVIHLAAQAGVRYSLLNPDAYVQSNLVGFVNVMECCRHFAVDHFLYASSSSVYGLQSEVPWKVGQPTDRPVSLYAATKKANEVMAYSYSHLYGIPATGLRFFTVYGPWGRPDMAYFHFTKAILAGEPIPVFHYGKTKRDFTYIADVVEAVTRLLALPPAAANGEAPHRIFNIGNREPVLLTDFIGILESLLDRKAIFDMKPSQPGDVEQTYADTSELSEAIGFEPNTPLEEGLKRFVAWYLSYV